MVGDKTYQLAVAIILSLIFISQAVQGTNDSIGKDSVVNVSEILDEIQNGTPVVYDHYIIKGDLILNRASLPKKSIKLNPIEFIESGDVNGFYYPNLETTEAASIKSDISITNSSFEGKVYLNNIIFQNLTWFDNDSFSDKAFFYRSQFNNYASFGRSRFNKDAFFDGSLFNNSVEFGGSQFNSTAHFSYTKFRGEANFGESSNSISDASNQSDPSDIEAEIHNVEAMFKLNMPKVPGAYFRGDAVFLNSEFDGQASFLGSRFNNNSYFDNVKFNGSPEFSFFWNSTFSKEASFRSTKFYNGAIFFNSRFDSDAIFDETEFNGNAAFPGTAFNGNASFESTRFNGDADFEGTKFNSTLFLDRAKYDKLYIKWDNIHKLAYDATAYQLLIENFRKLGFMADADVCYYQFRIEQFLHQNPIDDPFMSIFNFGAWIFYGYGKKPLYPFLWSLFIIGLFGVFWITISLRSPKDAINKYSLAKSWLRRVFSLFFMPLIMVIWEVIGLKKSKKAIDEYDQIENWPRNMRDAFSFSATVFLSGAKFLVDPPEVPVLPGVSQLLIKRAFLMERVLGAFFSILFFLAVGATIVR